MGAMPFRLWTMESVGKKSGKAKQSEPIHLNWRAEGERGGQEHHAVMGGLLQASKPDSANAIAPSESVAGLPLRLSSAFSRALMRTPVWCPRRRCQRRADGNKRTSVTSRQWVLVLLASVWLRGGHCVGDGPLKVENMTRFDEVTGAMPTLVKFYAPWCGHCSMMAPAFNSLAREVHGAWQGAQVADANCDASPDIANRFQVKGYPTLALIHKGQFQEYHGPKSMQAMLDFIKETVPRFHRRPNVWPPQTRCLNVARSDNGAHAESDGQKAGFGPFKAVDGKIRGTYGEHGEMALHSGWSWGTNLQQAMFLVAFDRMYSINRIKVFSGVGFVNQKITAFRLLFCNVKGGAYFSGYDTQSCWKPIPNVTAVNNWNSEGETLFRISKEKKNIVEAHRGVQMVELAMPPIRASGISIQVMSTDSQDNDGVLTEIEVYTEPKCSWHDGGSDYERGLIVEEELRRAEELKALVKEIKMKRAAEDAKIAVVEEAKQEQIRAANELLAQAETQFKVNNVMGQYGAYGLLEKARVKLEEAGVLDGRKKSLDELEVKYRRAIESEEARKKAEDSAKLKAKMEAEEARAKEGEQGKRKREKKEKKKKKKKAAHDMFDEDEGLML